MQHVTTRLGRVINIIFKNNSKMHPEIMMFLFGQTLLLVILNIGIFTKNKSFYSNLILMVMRDLNFMDIVCLTLDTA